MRHLLRVAILVLVCIKEQCLVKGLVTIRACMARVRVRCLLNSKFLCSLPDPNSLYSRSSLCLRNLYSHNSPYNPNLLSRCSNLRNHNSLLLLSQCNQHSRFSNHRTNRCLRLNHRENRETLCSHRDNQSILCRHRMLRITAHPRKSNRTNATLRVRAFLHARRYLVLNRKTLLYHA